MIKVTTCSNFSSSSLDITDNNIEIQTDELNDLSNSSESCVDGDCKPKSKNATNTSVHARKLLEFC